MVCAARSSGGSRVRSGPCGAGVEATERVSECGGCVLRVGAAGDQFAELGPFVIGQRLADVASEAGRVVASDGSEVGEDAYGPVGPLLNLLIIKRRLGRHHWKLWTDESRSGYLYVSHYYSPTSTLHYRAIGFR